MEKWKKKDKINLNILVFFPTNSLQTPTCNSSCEIFATNFPMYYIGVRDGKKEKEGKINLSFVFCPTIYLATLKVYTKIENSGFHRSSEICHSKFDWRERKIDK